MTDKSTKPAGANAASAKRAPATPAASRSTADKVAAAQKRNAERPGFREVIEDHPIAAVAGGILLGALLARALPRLPFGKIGRRASTLAAVGAELASLYGARAASAASVAGRDGREKLADLGETVADASSEARRRGAEIADVAIAGARSAGGSALRRVSELATRVRH